MILLTDGGKTFFGRPTGFCDVTYRKTRRATGKNVSGR
jgi:hypothetical protein